MYNKFSNLRAKKMTALAKGMGSLIRARRKKIGMSQKDLATAMGISQQLLSHYEKGRRNFRVEILINIAEALKCPVDELIPDDLIKGIDKPVKGAIIHTGKDAAVSDNQQGSPTTETDLLVARLLEKIRHMADLSEQERIVLAKMVEVIASNPRVRADVLNEFLESLGRNGLTDADVEAVLHKKEDTE